MFAALEGAQRAYFNFALGEGLVEAAVTFDLSGIRPSIRPPI